MVAARGNSPAARQALRALCETYYGPVEQFVRRACDRSHAVPADDARDLTHAFFARLLEGGSLDQADQTRGRFRSYLLGAVKHFLSDVRDRDLALKRGGRQQLQSLSGESARVDDEHGNGRIEIAAPDAFPPDAYFDREWALAVVQQAIDTLRSEAEASGELARFEILQRWLVAPSSHDSTVEAARELNLSEGTFKVAVHRLRKRFRHTVVTRVATTVDDPNEVQDELNYLIEAISAQPGD